MVILTTPTADKVTDIPWIYHPRVKKAAASCDEDTWKTVWDPKTPQCLVPKTMNLTHEGR